jgi:2-polyprenyl-3-methyl-5-hydroxy-6-metoxy-1,4-benzoquinol methylase
VLITESYREQNRQLHAARADYGMSGAARAPQVRPFADWGRKAILDFGCGKATLAARLGPAYRVTNYDPCIEGLDARPEPHPVVVCGDVLEHVEPECLDDVLAELRRVTQEVGLFVVHLTAAKKTLPDGRNAHLIQQPAEWWQARIAAAGFAVEKQDASPTEAWFIVRPAQ